MVVLSSLSFAGCPSRSFVGGSVTSLFVVVLSSYLSVSSFTVVPSSPLCLFVVVPPSLVCGGPFSSFFSFLFLRGGALSLFLFLCGGTPRKPPAPREREREDQGESRHCTERKPPTPQRTKNIHLCSFLFEAVPHLSLSLFMWWFLLALFRFRGGPSVHITQQHFTHKSPRRTHSHCSLQHLSFEQV